jgi:hypothetical protein
VLSALMRAGVMMRLQHDAYVRCRLQAVVQAVEQRRPGVVSGSRNQRPATTRRTVLLFNQPPARCVAVLSRLRGASAQERSAARLRDVVSYQVTCATISSSDCALELWHHACPSAQP